MFNTRPRGKTLRPAFRRSKRLALEALESRLLLSGNSYTIGAYSFTGVTDGAGPFAGLVADGAGDLFGTTVTGGASGKGTVYELIAGSNTVAALYSFSGTPDGANPYAGLTIDTFGDLFGTTFAGGASGDGTIFEIPAGGTTPNILYFFSGADGANPYADLILDSLGDIFGTTTKGGLFGHGTVFEIPSGGALTTLHSFGGATDGATPYSPLVRDKSGNLFGTTYAGGPSGDGTAFEISSGTFTTLHSFTDTPDGSKPTGRLVIDGGGNIFGTTSAGGTDGDGTIFGINGSDNTLATLYSFTGGIDGSSPFAGMVLDITGNLFGATYHGGAYGNGTIFEIPLDGVVPETLYSLTGGGDGANPYGPIFITAQGNLFGTSTTGGNNKQGALFELSPTLTTQITIAQQPTDIKAGSIITPAVVVDLKLAGGGINVADNSSVTLSIIDGPTDGTLSGTTTVQAVNGVARFGNVMLTRAGTYTLSASDGSLDPVTFDSFEVHPGPAARLAYDQQPTSFIAGQTMAPAMTVEVEDALGNLIATDNSMVTLKLASGPAGAVLTGTLAVQAVNGVATFDDLSLTKSGSYAVSVSDGKFPIVKSAAFVVAPDAAHGQLLIAHQPGSTVVGKVITPGLIINIQDQFGNLITSNTSQVSVSLVVLNLGGNATSAALTGTTTVNVIKGQASLNNLAISQPGNYALQVASGGLTPVTTNPILSYFVPTHMVFTRQPGLMTAGGTISPAIVVSILDASNRIDTTNNSLVTISLKGNAALGGTLSEQAVNGVATFSDLSLMTAGTYSLSAASGALLPAKSLNFTVVPDASTAHLVAVHLPVSPSVVGKALAPTLVVGIEDQFGNLITSNHSPATISIAAGPTAGTFTGLATVKANGGQITFTNIILSQAGTYSLQIVDASLADATPVLVAQTISQGVTSVSGLPSLSTHIFGQTIALSASFKSTAPGTVPFSGMATLTDGSDDVLGTATLTTAGLAKFNVTGIVPGAYVCTVSYPGDANHASVTSSTFTLQVSLAASSTSLATSSSSLVFGQPITLTASVKSTNAPGFPRSGSVSFYDGLNLLGTVALDGNSMASLTLTPATLGSHMFKAIYSGDSNFKVSTSPGASRTVNKDKTSITLTPTVAGPVPENQAFDLNIHVALLAPGISTLTGNLVTIKDNGKTIATINLDSNGDATLPGLSYSAAGTHSLSAIYAGDVDTLPVTSPLLKLTIT